MEGSAIARAAEIGGEVAEFVRRHPHLEAILEEARTRIGAAFGPDVRVRFEVFRDPEREADTEGTLFALVDVSALDPDEARLRRDRLWDGWWLDALPRARGDLVIATSASVPATGAAIPSGA